MLPRSMSKFVILRPPRREGWVTTTGRIPGLFATFTTTSTEFFIGRLRPESRMKASLQWEGVDLDRVLAQTGQRRRRVENILSSRLQWMIFQRPPLQPAVASIGSASAEKSLVPKLLIQEAGIPEFRLPTTYNSTTHESLYIDLPYDDSIRVLEIRPGKQDDDLVCELHSTRFQNEDFPEFEALSYVWGAKEPPASILCSGQKLDVGQNLFTALRRLRLPNRSRLVWADAICINQSNVKERSHQVSLMKRIYEAATRVTVYLGGAKPEDAEVVLPLICSIINVHYDSPGAAGFSKLGQAFGFVNTIPTTELRESWAPWFVLSKFYELEWFWRLWVIQEVALARSAVAIWGDYEIPWKWIGLAAALVRTNYPILARICKNGISNAYFIYRVSSNQTSSEPLSLDFFQLLGLTRQFQVSDDRDRIYGLLGLPCKGGLFMKPDYTLSTTDLYMRVAETFLENDQSLRVLSSVQHFANFFETPMLRRSPWPSDDLSSGPSWVPRWDAVFANALTPWDPEQNHSASAGIPLNRIRSADPGSLTIQGLEVDTVAEVLPRINSTIRRGQSLISSLSQYFESEANLILLSRTMTAGKNWYGLFIEDNEKHLADAMAYWVQERQDQAQEESSRPSPFPYYYGGMRNPSYKYLVILLEEILRNEWNYLKGEYPRDTWTSRGWSSLGTRSWQYFRLAAPDAGREAVVLGPADPLRSAAGLDVDALAAGGDASGFQTAMQRACEGRRLFRTMRGYLGLGPVGMREGDRVVVLFGGDVPFVLRPRQAGEGTFRWLLMGECYVEGLMHGEAVAEWREQRLRDEYFNMV